MKRLFNALACLLALLIIITPISLLSIADGSQEAIINAVDFSDLPVSDKAYYQKKCLLDTESDIFKLGIMLDSADTIGVGTDKTNFKGFYARDNDDDGITDTLTAASYNNKGMRFTLGVDLVNDWSSAEAIVLHLDNSTNNWTAWQEIELTLITADGERIALKAESAVGDTTALFIDDTELTVTNCSIAEDGYKLMPGNKSGYVVLPITAFENNDDLSNITAIAFNMSSKASIFTSIKTIGFTSSINSLLGEIVGGTPNNITLEKTVGGSAVIKVDGFVSNTAVAGSTVKVEATADSGNVLGAISVTSMDGSQIVETEGLEFVMPDFDVRIALIFDKISATGMPSRYYGKLVDLSVITPGDYRAHTWDCMLDTITEPYTKGVVIDREPLGTGNTNVNYHGFRAYDADGDTKTDYLQPQPYNDKGMRFTFGFNSVSNMPEMKEALVLKMDNKEISGSQWNENTMQRINLTLIDDKGNEYKMKAPEEAGESIIKIIDPDTFAVTDFSPKEKGGYAFVPTLKTSWIIIPIDLFDGLQGDESLTALSFDAASTWNAYTSYYEVGMTSSIDDIVRFLTGKAERYEIAVNEPENGKIIIDTNLAKEGTAINISAVADDGYILESVTVTEKESGNSVLAAKTGFVMPACDVIVTVKFNESSYNDSKKLEEVYTITQDFSTVEIVDHIDWELGPDLTPLIEQGALIEDLDRGFKDAGVNNCYNGNGIYIQDDGLGFGTSLRLWTHDNTGLSLSLKSNDVLPNTYYEGVVLHLHTDLMRSDKIPALSLTLYKKKADGTPDLDNPIKPKSAASLYGTTVRLVNDETGEVTERPLGYSPEEGASMDNNAKNFSQYIVPDGFAGYVLVPFSYFSQSFEASEIAGIRLNYNVTDWYMYSNIYDVGFTQSISNFVRIASLGNYSDMQLIENRYDVEADVFERYKGAEKSLKITVLKDLLMHYMWSMSGLDIQRAIAFDPTISFGNGSTNGVDKFYGDAVDSVYLEIPQKTLPGNMSLTIDVSWDFYDGTYVTLFKYDPLSGKMTSTGKEAIVDSGFVTFNFAEGGKFLLAMRQLTPHGYEEDEPDAPPQISETITNTTEIQEVTGHYETISGDKKYKTVRTKRFIGYETWFIVLMVVIIALVLVAGALTAFIIIKKKRGKKNA